MKKRNTDRSQLRRQDLKICVTQENSAQMGAVHKWVAPGLSMLGQLSDNDPGKDHHREKRRCQNCDKPVQYISHEVTSSLAVVAALRSEGGLWPSLKFYTPDALPSLC